MFLRFVTESQFPDLLSLPVHVVESMMKALKMNSEEARLKFPRLLQIIELYPSETLDLITKEVIILKPGMSCCVKTKLSFKNQLFLLFVILNL